MARDFGPQSAELQVRAAILSHFPPFATPTIATMAAVRE